MNIFAIVSAIRKHREIQFVASCCYYEREHEHLNLPFKGKIVAEMVTGGRIRDIMK